MHPQRANPTTDFALVAARHRTQFVPYRQELTVGVGDTPEILEHETPIPAAAERDEGRARPRKSNGKRKTRSAADVEVPLANGGPAKDRRASRERSLNRLLAGLRAVNAGDFSVLLVPDGDPLVADIIEVFNSVVQKQSRLVDELTRVSGSVGREGKMGDRVAMTSVGGQWVAAVDSVNSLITDLV